MCPWGYPLGRHTRDSDSHRSRRLWGVAWGVGGGVDFVLAGCRGGGFVWGSPL